jgi:adenylate kinase
VARNFIILISGVPGTGKSSVGLKLAELLSCKLIEVSELARSRGLIEKDPSGRFTGMIKHSGIEVLSDILLEYRRKGCIIAATTYPEVFIDSLEDALPFICILRTHPLVLEERLSARSWPRAKILENVIAEATNYYAEVLWDRSDMVFEVDTTNRNPSSSVDELLALVESWRTGFYKDWLTDPRVLEVLPKWMRELDTYKERLS